MVQGVAIVVTCFALVALLLAWSRWLARRRLAAAGHATMAIAARPTRKKRRAIGESPERDAMSRCVGPNA